MEGGIIRKGEERGKGGILGKARRERGRERERRGERRWGKGGKKAPFEPFSSFGPTLKKSWVGTPLVLILFLSPRTRSAKKYIGAYIFLIRCPLLFIVFFPPSLLLNLRERGSESREKKGGGVKG
ncbi:hypothetical protein IE53DRAFT_31811 [Violaceomyces palustris]|uniref:Uncharacterized protein n=1 Tax=Violaceomyces palustris TaxID=1673888 RepID=A0ACD0P1I4_9BASI|nr:hypothetical protein IE53DRAFT_31811 [Violaceomyces palustris]